MLFSRSLAAMGFAVAACVAAPALDAQTTRFRVRVENVSGSSSLPGPFAPGVWATHAEPGAFFANDFEALAEDGSPGGLAEAVAGNAAFAASGVFAVPTGGTDPAPIFPGGAYEFEFEADASTPYLSFGTMLVQSNDLFAAPMQSGLRVFDASGMPQTGDVSDALVLWDAGSERNEAPGAGPNQAPRQAGPNTGPAEGVVSAFANATRALPLPRGIVDVQVRAVTEALEVTVTNVSAMRGALTTPVAPVFWAVHDASWSLFEAGGEASAGLEALAEDGGPGGLVGEHGDAAGVAAAGAQPITNERPGDDPGPAFPGESFTFEVPLDADHPYLSLACMVVESNDAFLAFGPQGVALFADGVLRPDDELAAAITAALAVWDAGTEANEVPGAGAHQPIRQSMPNSGPADPMSGVRVYADATDDLAGENAGGFATVTVTNGAAAGMFEVRVQNTSGATAFPGVLTPVAWATHSAVASLFTIGAPASEGLERLSEDGDPSVLAAELDLAMGVASSGVANLPVGADMPGPIFPGGEYTFAVVVDADAPYLSLASMIVPSNDTFLAFEPQGLRLLDENGMPRSDAELAADIAAQRLAWDAGTEANQAGAAGPDQAPRQTGPNTGPAEGTGALRVLDDPVWDHPSVAEVLRVTITTVDEATPFVRGDANADGSVDMSDVMSSLNYLFLGSEPPSCVDTLDLDDSGRLNITDPIFLLRFLFLGGAAIPAPSMECGPDATDDAITCDAFDPC